MDKRSSNFDDKTGRKYGDLIVLKLQEIKQYSNGKKKSIWLCQCYCGKTLPVIAGNLTSGNTTNCGCKRVERLQTYVDTILRLPKGEAAFNTVYAKYEFGSNRRNLAFKLSKEDFKAFCLGDCDYCGIPPSNVEADYGTKNGEFIYNGIDRVDNSVGYVLGNCVSCCRVCNYMKRTMEREAFLNHITAIYRKSIGDTKCQKVS
jgi:hypothetical protein